MTAADGTLTLTVWPAYIGVCTENPGPGPIAYGEPDTANYMRGQITWSLEGEEIVGRAAISVPVGVFTYMAYFRGPQGPCMSGKMQLDHPIIFHRPGTIDVYPITNRDLSVNKR